MRLLCVYGAARACPWGSVAELAETADVQRILGRTHGYVNPVQYSEYLSLQEATAWLRSEMLRDFPPVAFTHRGTPACDRIQSALVWSVDAAALFPAVCRQRARELLFILWKEERLEHSLIVTGVLPFLVDRW